MSRPLFLAGSSLLLLHTPAAAEFDPQAAVQKAIARTCSDRAGQAVSRERLAEALLIETETGLPDDQPSAVASISSPDLVVNRAMHQRHLLEGVKSLLLQDLALPGSDVAKALTVTPTPPASGIVTQDWLFSGPAAFTLTCARQKPPSEPQFAPIPIVMARKSATELAKIGKERKTAGSAQIAFDSTRVTDLKNQTKRTRKLLINAALGARLFGNEDRYAILFGEYSRSRARIRTRPTPVDPAKNGSADDINALELGTLGTGRLGDFARLTGRAGYIMDFETGARFISGGASLVPITGGGIDLGICNFGSFKYLALGIDAECTGSLELDVRHVVRKGEATLTPKDYIVAAGPAVGIAFRRTLDINGKPQDGLTGSVTYRYLPVLTGTAPDLERLEAAIAYRWWDGDIGFDLGLTYADGIERKSLGDEHRYGFMFGLVY